MSEELVPVTMGSDRFVARELAHLAVNALWFPPTLHLQPHTHDRPVFGVMLDGSMHGRLGRRRYHCTPNTVFTEPAGERHDNYFAQTGARIIAVLPDTTSSALFDSFRDLLGRPAQFQDARISTMGMRALREMTNPDTLSPLAVESLVYEMFIEAARLQWRTEACQPPPAWLERTRQLLDDRAFEPLRLNDVAKESGMHPRHLTRMFRSCYGISVAAYVRVRRLEWVAEQLRSSRLSLAEIAMKAGFADQSHLTRRFRDHIGCTPGEFRRLLARTRPRVQ
jgi:AraC family transcriptional regulator